MDYDDDDISRHNIQLASEGRSRSSSVLRPYEFPKFDFDDNLQGNLRFDSLVETEVFLGIQSQEDNQWIEGYSQVSNGMEFNSTPVDSCSISRRDNVWSEATSSESVEMLLKSVGQEEMMPAASIIPGTDVCDDQDALARHVEPGAGLDMRNSDTKGTHDDVPKVLSQNIPVEEQSQPVEISSLNSETVGSSSEHCQNLVQDTVCAKSDLLSNEEEQDIECADKNLQEPKTSGCSQVTVLGTSEASLEVKHASISEGGNERHVSVGTSPQDTVNLEGKSGKGSIDISVRDSTPVLVLDSKVESSVDAVKASLDCPKPKDSGSIFSEDQCKLVIPEGDEKTLSLRNSALTDDCEVKALATSSGIETPVDGCQDGLPVDSSNQHFAELGCFAEDRASLDQKRDSSMHLIARQDDRMLDDVQTSQSQSRDSSVTPLLVDNNQVSIERSGLINNTDVPQSFNTDLSSSDTDIIKSSKAEGHVHDIESTKEGLGDFISGHSREVIEENLSHAQAELSATTETICESSEKDGKLFVNPGILETESVEMVTTNPRPQSLGEEGVVKGDDSLCDIQNQSSGRTKADELDPHARSNVMVAVAEGLDDRQGGLSVIGVPHSDCNLEDDGMTKASDAHRRSGAGSVSETEAASEYAQGPLSEVAAATCLQPAKESNEMSIRKSPSSEATNSMPLDNPNVDVGCEKSNLKESCDAVLGDEYNHDVTTVKLGGDQESTQVAEVDKASCGSPTIISSSETSLMETNDQEDARGSEVTENLVKDSQPTSEDTKGKSLLGDDNSFTFRVNATPDATQEPGKSWSPLQEADKYDSATVVKESVPSCKGKKERLPSPKTPRQGTQVTDVQPSQGTSKGIYERKRRRAPKESAKKGSQAKGTSQENSAVVVEKGLNNSLSSPSSSPYVQFGHMQSYVSAEESSKLSLAAIRATSNLPDLNATTLNKSTSTSPTSRQPFTDMQQVQLRAQIFVYGSLIQGTAPDEACMISAFGPSEAGRSSWDPVWRTAIERVRSNKSSSSNSATPLHSQSGTRTSDLSGKHSSQLTKVHLTPISKVSIKDTPPTITSPMIPLSSPLWSITTPSRDSLPSSTTHKGPVVEFQQSVPPLHPYQTPPIKNFSGHTSWTSQACFPGPPWVASPQNVAFSPSVRFQPVTMTETVKLTPVKDSSVPLGSGVKHMKSTLAVNPVGSSPVHGGVSSLRDTKTIPPEIHSGELKPRKRKKTTASDHVTSVAASEAQAMPMMVHSVDVLESSPVSAVSAPTCSAPDVAPADFAICTTDLPKKSELMTVDVCSEETLENVNEAKAQAEIAAVFAANAVTHCEDLWGKLAKQKESGSTSEMETKMISAAATIAAAASVAKAAAAAAKVAFNAALQAKLLADEAFLSSEPDLVVSSNSKSCTNVHIRNATPASILKGEKSSTESSSILIAAKEAAKRRVEAASAASKQAENLDAIVKAAELAASAVSQAGKIVAMGEPLPLADLIEAGPDGYWKLPQTSAELGGRLRDQNKEQAGAFDLKEVADVHGKAAKGGPRKRSYVKQRKREELKDSMDTGTSLTDGLTRSLDPVEKKSSYGRDEEKSTRVPSQHENSLITNSMHNEDENFPSTLSDDSIMEGSPVEVLKSGGSLKTAWYSANVLKLVDRKAFVSYSDLSSGEDSGNLCEWVSLEGEGEKAPVIRASHPLNSLQYQGTRKRRRGVLGDYAWGIGDKVDVWIDDCWWEGVVTEKNEKDETTLKVHFPAQGETSTVRAWNLRTSRSWIDGKWVECSPWKSHHSSDQTDTPREKRQKMGSPVIATKVKDLTYNEGKLAVENPVESKKLPLSTSEGKFDIGKFTKEDSRGIARRPPLRSGQQKEGSRVIFGVPKPTGKMRKFMEVGKNIPASKGDKSTAGPEQVKFGKYTMPQTSVSQGWKVPSRNFSRETRTVESRPKVPTTRKSHRTLPQRDNLGSKSGDGVGKTDPVTGAKDSGGFSAIDESAEAPLSSLISHSFSAGSKKVPSSNSRSGRPNRGKVGPAGKLSKIEEDKAGSSDSGVVNEANEPRRSNRRFQPTHRLLEGLQSSMVIPKLPSVSHDKPQRNPSRNAFARGK